MQLTLTYPFGRGLPAVALALAVCLLTLAGVRPGQAQNLFSAAVTVNDEVVTHFEIAQRAKFLEILRAPGDYEENAREALIDERLRQQAIDEAGITVSEDQVREGIVQFAERTNLSPVELLRELGKEGIEPETLRDFVRIGVAWRTFIRDRFLTEARPSEAEIDRALAEDTSGRDLRVLLTEIIIPTTPENREQVEALADEISDLTTYAEFEEAARRFSAAPTRNNSGRLGWLTLSTLPPVIAALAREMNPGDVSNPVVLPNAVAIFQLRGVGEVVGPAPRYASIDYATYLIPGGRSPETLAAAQTLANSIDRCDDLYAIAPTQPDRILERHDLPPGQIPRDIALELAKLDAGEISTTLTRSDGQMLMFLMVCGRTAIQNRDVAREEVSAALTQQRLTQLSESYLAQLRANALIVER